MNRICFLLLPMMVLMTSHDLRAQEHWFSMGLKIGYTFGDDGGWTVGFEGSYMAQRVQIGQTAVYGYHAFQAVTFDLNVGPNYTLNLHFGYESIFGGIAGLDIGPSLLIDSSKEIYPAIGIIGFAGLGIYPFYELRMFPTQGWTTFETVGTYIKFPVLPRGYDGLQKY